MKLKGVNQKLVRLGYDVVEKFSSDGVTSFEATKGKSKLSFDAIDGKVKFIVSINFRGVPQRMNSVGGAVRFISNHLLQNEKTRIQKSISWAQRHIARAELLKARMNRKVARMAKNLMGESGISGAIKA